MILCIQTSTPYCSFSLVDLNGTVQYEYHAASENSHSEVLLPEIQKMNEEFPVQKLNAIAVITGPGSYTGLRIGLSASKGLAFPKNIPLIGIDNLTLLLSQVNYKEKTNLAALMRARKGEYFFKTNVEGFAENKKLLSSEDLVVNLKNLNKNADLKILIYEGNKIEDSLSDFKLEIFEPRASLMNNLAVDWFNKGKLSSVFELQADYMKEFYTVNRKKIDGGN